ncbi:MAG: hypothetical protein WBV06_03300 [Acidimicrobiia bacterium]
MATSVKLLINERYIALVGVLNRELSILERLTFKLTQAEMLARADESRFLPKIFDEIDAIRDDLGALEVARSMLVGDVTAALGLANDSLTLTQLIAYAPDLAVAPLEGLKRRMVATMDEIKELQELGSRMVVERIDNITRAIDRVEPTAFGRSGYDAIGLTTPPATSSSFFDYNA